MTKEKLVKEKNYFEVLSAISVKDKIEKKGKLSYLSWSYAWSEVKKIHPEVKRLVNKNNEGWLYHTDGRTCWVDVSVTVNDIEEVEYLPVMDCRNHSIPLNKVTANDVNTAIQRATTKAIARHGLGLCVYSGEDITEEEVNKQRLANIASQDMQKTMKEVNEKEFRRLKKVIEDCKNSKELNALCEAEKAALNKLGNHAKDLFEILKETKALMQDVFNKQEEIAA